MLERLLTEQQNPASANIDALTTDQILAVMNGEDAKVADAVAAEIPQIARAVDAIVDSLSHGGRLFYIGAGTSGRLGVLDASECPPTFNVPPTLVQGIIAGGTPALTRSSEAVEDKAEIGAQDLRAAEFGAADVLVGIAASGRTPYVLGAIAEATQMGAVTIGISCTPDSELARAVAIPITPLTGPEILTGSTRMKAGTATKLVLNMLSTATMIRLGHVYGNLMVNVQPSNAKLKNRACRIIEQAAGVDTGKAESLLAASGGVVKVAIVMGRLGVNREEAELRLQTAEGRVSKALDG